ncbi:MAG: hypothetical protein J6866_02730, partial [Victivallales bacterium]|nr:hypothetical protein [Victivallales bacterium]
AILLYCNKFMKNVADFLAAGRCAGRYMLSISDGIANFAVISVVASFEEFYKAGFAPNWWSMLTSPINIILALVAWVTYRLRETRCFTLSQFFEVRYSKKFRVASGIICWLAGVLNYGIFPAVTVRFFVSFCRFPEYFHFLGLNWNTYGTCLAICLGVGVFFATCGGQVAIMITDFLQGTFCNISFIIFILFIFKLGSWDFTGGFVTWDQIAGSLETAAGKSQINPFNSGNVDGFNIWYYIIGIIGALWARGSWQSGNSYRAAAKTPHEHKMAGILGTWRGMAQTLMVLLFPLAIIVIMKHEAFRPIADAINSRLDLISDPHLRQQSIVSTALSTIIPTGLLGLFVAVMVASAISTDDTYIHSWGCLLIQDVIMPFRKEPLTTKQHIWFLRGSIIFVGLFAWLFSFYYKQTDYILMFFWLTGSIVTGAGAAIVGGLYWKRGSTLGAWVSFILGAVVAIGVMVIQMVWKFEDGGGLARFLIDHFHWQWVINNPDKFPLNGRWVSLINMFGCLVCYVAFSLYEHYVLKKPDFNLDKMLHRGIYDIANEHVEATGKLGVIAQRLGITKEFSTGDKVIYGSSLLWTFSWFVVFIVFSAKHFLFGGVSDDLWRALWHCHLYIVLVLAFVTTIWFLIGGIRDAFRLFRDLKQNVRNDADNGQVIDGRNAGEEAMDAVKEAEPADK